MQISQLLTPEAVQLDLQGRTREDVLREIVDHLVSVYPQLRKARDKLYRKLLEREQLEPTALENGTAIPHCKYEGLEQPVLTIARSRQGVDFGARNGKPTHLFFTVISPNRQPALHLKVLASIAHLLKDNQRVQAMMRAENARELLEILKSWELET